MKAALPVSLSPWLWHGVRAASGNWYTSFKLCKASHPPLCSFPSLSGLHWCLRSLNSWTSASFSLCTTHFGLSSHFLPPRVLLSVCLASQRRVKLHGSQDHRFCSPQFLPDISNAVRPFGDTQRNVHYVEEFCFLEFFTFYLLRLSMFSTINMRYLCTFLSSQKNIGKSGPVGTGLSP